MGRLTIVVASLLAAVGCGGDRASVTGLVTLDGEPVRGGKATRGTVLFYPAAGRGAPAVALLDENGQYNLATGGAAGLEPGAYAVTIQGVHVDEPQLNRMPEVRPFTPAKYADPNTSGFTVSVERGRNQFDFHLESAAPAGPR